MECTRIVLILSLFLLTSSIIRLIFISKNLLSDSFYTPLVFWSADYGSLKADAALDLHRVPPSMNYSTQNKDWYFYGNLDPFESYNPYQKKCLLCHFTVRNVDPNSTPRDVIFSFMFSDIAGLLPFT